MDDLTRDIEEWRRRMRGGEGDLMSVACHALEREVTARVVQRLIARAEEESQALVERLAPRLPAPQPLHAVNQSPRYAEEDHYGINDYAWDETLDRLRRERREVA